MFMPVQGRVEGKYRQNRLLNLFSREQNKNGEIYNLLNSDICICNNIYQKNK